LKGRGRDAWPQPVAVPSGVNGRRAASFAASLAVLVAGGPAGADPGRPGVTDPPEIVRPRDEIVVWIGPELSAVRLDEGWDTGVGGVLAVGLRRPRRLAILAGEVHGISLADRGGGRLGGAASVGLRTGFGPIVGLSVGPVVEVDAVRPPRWGGEATGWIVAGLGAFVRVAALDQIGRSLEIGLAVPLPTLSW
jgi:hypothetical protein